MPSEGSDGIGAGESAGCRMGFSLPFPSIPHFYRFHRIHRIRPFRRPSPTQLNRHSHGSGNLESRGFQSFPIDSRRVRGLDSRLRGNDGFQDCAVIGRVSRLRCCRNATEPSFPRKWESRILGFQSFPIDSRRVGGLDSRLRGNDGFLKITVLSDGFRDCGVVGTQLNRHSHGSGNLESRGFSHFR